MKILICFLLLAFAFPVSSQCEHTIDSLRTELHIAEAEARESQHVSEFIVNMHRPLAEKLQPKQNLMLPFIKVGAHGAAHNDAVVFGGFGIDMILHNIGLSASANYERDSVKWKPVFYGELKLFLY